MVAGSVDEATHKIATCTKIIAFQGRSPVHGQRNLFSAESQGKPKKQSMHEACGGGGGGGLGDCVSVLCFSHSKQMFVHIGSIHSKEKNERSCCRSFKETFVLKGRRKIKTIMATMEEGVEIKF